MKDNPALVLAHNQIASKLWKLVLAVDDIPKIVKPGQFVQVQLGTHTEFILRRPFSVYTVMADEQSGQSCLVLVYQVTGRGTAYLTGFKEGDRLKVLGPLGRGWQPHEDIRHALLVGGGVGWAPLSLLAERLQAKQVEVHALIGAQTAENLTVFAAQPQRSHCAESNLKNETVLGSHDKKTARYNTGNAAQGGESADEAFLKQTAPDAYVEHFATDDGSRGYHGFTTDLLPELLSTYDFDYIATCGPEAMQKRVAELAFRADIFCEVSLERRMACGIGSCLGCVVETTQGRKRACADGPVFNALEVCW